MGTNLARRRQMRGKKTSDRAVNAAKSKARAGLSRTQSCVRLVPWSFASHTVGIAPSKNRHSYRLNHATRPCVFGYGTFSGDKT